MADNFQITEGAGITIAAVDVAGTKEQKIQITNFPASQPVTGTFFQATQPISGTVTANQGGIWTVQPGNTVNTTAWKIDGSAVTQPVSGTVTISNTGFNVNNPVQVAGSTLCVSITGAAAAAVTATLPAVASNFHYISLIELYKVFTAANVASATPLVVTSTNLPGALAWSFGQATGTIGGEVIRVYAPNAPLRSSVVNTTSTIVCPATAGIIWRINVYYFTAV